MSEEEKNRLLEARKILNSYEVPTDWPLRAKTIDPAEEWRKIHWRCPSTAPETGETFIANRFQYEGPCIAQYAKDIDCFVTFDAAFSIEKGGVPGDRMAVAISGWVPLQEIIDPYDID